MSSIEFWEWFVKNSRRYLYINTLSPEEKNKMLDEFEHALHRYCEALYFEIGGTREGKNELIFSAGGNRAYFDEVEELVSAAPSLSEWSVIAFKPPRGFRFKLNFEGSHINTDHIWFRPISFNGKKVALMLFFRDYTDLGRDAFISAAYIVLETILGERVVGSQIEYIDVAPLPKDTTDIGKIESIQEWIKQL
jgi:hypothetical protein